METKCIFYATSIMILEICTGANENNKHLEIYTGANIFKKNLWMTHPLMLLIAWLYKTRINQNLSFSVLK